MLPLLTPGSLHHWANRKYSPESVILWPMKNWQRYPLMGRYGVWPQVGLSPFCYADSPVCTYVVTGPRVCCSWTSLTVPFAEVSGSLHAVIRCLSIYTCRLYCIYLLSTIQKNYSTKFKPWNSQLWIGPAKLDLCRWSDYLLTWERHLTDFVPHSLGVSVVSRWRHQYIIGGWLTNLVTYWSNVAHQASSDQQGGVIGCKMQDGDHSNSKVHLTLQ